MFQNDFKSQNSHSEFSTIATRNHLNLFIWRPTQSRSLAQIKFPLKVNMEKIELWWKNPILSLWFAN